MKNKNIYVLASINQDLSIEAPYFPKAGETLLGRSLQSSFGGKGLNQALALKKAGLNPFIIGQIGNDNVKDNLFFFLNEHGLIANNITVSEKFKTTTAIIIVSSGENRIVLSDGANMHITNEHVISSLSSIKRDDILLLQSEVNEDAIKKAIEIAKKSKAYIIYNNAPSRNIDALLPLIDLVIVNEIEASMMSNIHVCDFESAKKAYDVLENKGAKSLIITLGESGSYYFDKDNTLFVPAKSVSAIDSTSAGDTYIGYLIYGLVNDFSMKSSLELATKASAITVTRRGSIDSIPILDEVIK